MGSEVWQPALGLEDEYEVSNLGRVRRIGRKRGAKVGRVLRPYSTGKGKGYLHVTIRAIGHPRQTSVARLVLSSFSGPPPIDRPQVNHLDGDPHNNRLENLEWASGSENLKHAYVHALRSYPVQRGSLNHNARLNEDGVRQILTSTEPAKNLAQRLGVSPQTVYMVRWRKIWTHVKADGL